MISNGPSSMSMIFMEHGRKSTLTFTLNMPPVAVLILFNLTLFTRPRTTPPYVRVT